MQRSESKDDGLMPFGDHLEELRRRLLLAMAVPLPLLIGFFFISDWLLVVVLRPVQQALAARGLDASLQVLTPPETLLAKMKLSIVAAVIVSAPWILWQGWMFVAPGLYRHEKRFVHFLVPLSAVLSLLGVAMLYWIMLPLMMQVLVHFTARIQFPPKKLDAAERAAWVLLAEAETIPIVAAVPDAPAPGATWLLVPDNVTQVAVPVDAADLAGGVRVVTVPRLAPPGIQQPFRVSYVVNLVLVLALGVAVAFQLPVVILLAGWLDIVRVEWLCANRKFALFACAVASAVGTPADVVSMVLLLVPLYGLYEFGILLLRVVPPSRVAGGLRTARDGEDGERGPTASSPPVGPSDGEGRTASESEAPPSREDPASTPPRIVPADDAVPRRRPGEEPSGEDDDADEDDPERSGD